MTGENLEAFMATMLGSVAAVSVEDAARNWLAITTG